MQVTVIFFSVIYASIYYTYIWLSFSLFTCNAAWCLHWASSVLNSKSKLDNVVKFWYIFWLSRLVAPLIQGYEDAGDFTMMERLKTSIHVNLIFYFIVGSIGLFGLVLLFTLRNKRLVHTATIYGFTLVETTLRIL